MGNDTAYYRILSMLQKHTEKGGKDSNKMPDVRQTSSSLYLHVHPSKQYSFLSLGRAVAQVNSLLSRFKEQTLWTHNTTGIDGSTVSHPAQRKVQVYRADRGQTDIYDISSSHSHIKLTGTHSAQCG